VLLYVVLSIVDQAVDPDPVTLDTGDTPDAIAPPAINNRADLELALKGNSISLIDAINSSIVWFERRGFLGKLDLYGVSTADSISANYLEMSEAQLLELAGTGDIGAAQQLAELSLNGDNPDPEAVIEWYRQAASLGSVYAMFRLSELLELFSDPLLADFNKGSLYAMRLEKLLAQEPLIRRDALAWSLTAVLAGGLPAAQNDVATRVQRLSAELGAQGTNRACDKANRLLLDLAAERRSRGGLVFSTEPPELFVSLPTLDDVLPCEQALPPVIDTTGCDVVAVPGLVNPNQKLWHCPPAPL